MVSHESVAGAVLARIARGPLARPALIGWPGCSPTRSTPAPPRPTPRSCAPPSGRPPSSSGSGVRNLRHGPARRGPGAVQPAAALPGAAADATRRPARCCWCTAAGCRRRSGRTGRIDALAALRAAGVPAVLVVAGDGPLRAAAGAPGGGAGLPVHVHRLHRRPRRRWPRCWPRADVVLAPGPVETFGLAALEALACGTPVVVNARQRAARGDRRGRGDGGPARTSPAGCQRAGSGRPRSGGRRPGPTPSGSAGRPRSAASWPRTAWPPGWRWLRRR